MGNYLGLCILTATRTGLCDGAEPPVDAGVMGRRRQRFCSELGGNPQPCFQRLWAMILGTFGIPADPTTQESSIHFKTAAPKFENFNSGVL